VRETTLGLGRPRDEHLQSLRARVFDAREPDRRLPDAGRSLEHERVGLSRGTFDEGAHGGDLLVATNDLERHVLPLPER
jgi:hypothetical protein